jgi:hypothetical protein
MAEQKSIVNESKTCDDENRFNGNGDQVMDL